MQLDATLRSFFLHCRDANQVHLFVIYKTSGLPHAEQYALLAREYPRVGFIRQEVFRRDVLELIIAKSTLRSIGSLRRWLMGKGPWLGRLGTCRITFDHVCYVLFLVDDNIFVRDFSLHEIQEKLEAYPRALGFSLRLGANTRYCYPLDKPQKVPKLTRVDSDVMMFDWASAGDSGHDFGYPLEVSSSVYRVSELFPLLGQLPFQNPNALEGQMAAHTHRFRADHPLLLCCERSVTFCAPLNRVQTVSENRVSAVPAYSAERLAQMFDEGYRIKVEAYSGFVPNGCHQEVELLFTKHVAGKEAA